MKRAAWLACAVGLTAALPSGSAHANASAQKLGAFLDADAPAAARIDLDSWEELVDLYRQSGLPAASQTVFGASLLANGVLGFDPFVENGWIKAGFDVQAPILATIGAIDQKAARAKAAGTHKGTVFWRSRVVLLAANTGTVDGTLRKLGRVLPGMTEVSSASAGDVATAVGMPAAAGPRVARSLGRRNVRVVGRIPLVDTLVFLHRQGDVVVLDLFTPFGGGPVDWKTDGPRIESALVRKPGRFWARTTKGAAQALADDGMALWLDGPRAYDAYGLLERDLDRRLVRAGGSGLPGLAHRSKVCDGFRDMVTAGPFTDVSVGLVLERSRGLAVGGHILWGLRGAFKLASAMLLADDGLGDPADLVQTRGASFAMATYLRSLEPLRAMPRPALLSGPRNDLLWALAHCGLRGPASLALMGWPQALAMFADEVAAIDPKAALLVDGVRNTLLVVKKAALDRRSLVAIAEASVDAKAVPTIESYLDLLFGSRARKKGYTSWGRGPIRPYRRTQGKRTVIGTGFTPRVVRWWTRLPRRQPPSPSQTLVLEAHADPGRLAKQLGLRAAPGVTSRMEGTRFLLRFSRGSLHGTLWTRIK